MNQVLEGGAAPTQPITERSRVKISIVTLSFNQRAYLQEAMDSVLSQEYPDLEYIVVDPGSSDGSRALVSSYGDPNQPAPFLSPIAGRLTGSIRDLRVQQGIFTAF